MFKKYKKLYIEKKKKKYIQKGKGPILSKLTNNDINTNKLIPEIPTNLTPIVNTFNNNTNPFTNTPIDEVFPNVVSSNEVFPNVVFPENDGIIDTIDPLQIKIPKQEWENEKIHCG